MTITPDSVKVEDYLKLNRAALEQLAPRDRLSVLAELARSASTWLRNERGEQVDALRAQYGPDSAVAEHMGCSAQILTDLGDGARVQLADGDYAYPRLLLRGAEIIAKYTDDAVPNQHLNETLSMLSRRGPSNGKRALFGAASLCSALRSIPEPERGVPDVELRTLRRAIEHAYGIAQRETQ